VRTDRLDFFKYLLRANRRLCAIVLLIAAGPNTPIASDLSNLGEQLEYHLSYKGIKAATSKMWLETHDSTTTIIWTVKSRPFVTLLFKIDNRYEAIIDKNGRLLRANKTIDQKNIRQQWTIDYSRKISRATSNRNYNWPITADCRHILSMLYDLRERTLTPGESLHYILDVESQIWQLDGNVRPIHDQAGNFQAYEIVFHFSPALDIKQRAWKTDLLTNRLARKDSQLTIRLGRQRRPLLIRFGGDDGIVEMKLRN